MHNFYLKSWFLGIIMLFACQVAFGISYQQHLDNVWREPGNDAQRLFKYVGEGGLKFLEESEKQSDEIVKKNLLEFHKPLTSHAKALTEWTGTDNIPVMFLYSLNLWIESIMGNKDTPFLPYRDFISNKITNTLNGNLFGFSSRRATADEEQAMLSAAFNNGKYISSLPHFSDERVFAKKIMSSYKVPPSYEPKNPQEEHCFIAATATLGGRFERDKSAAVRSLGRPGLLRDTKFVERISAILENANDHYQAYVKEFEELVRDNPKIQDDDSQQDAVLQLPEVQRDEIYEDDAHSGGEILEQPKDDDFRGELLDDDALAFLPLSAPLYLDLMKDSGEMKAQKLELEPSLEGDLFNLYFAEYSLQNLGTGFTTPIEYAYNPHSLYNDLRGIVGLYQVSEQSQPALKNLSLVIKVAVNRWQIAAFLTGREDAEVPGEDILDYISNIKIDDFGESNGIKKYSKHFLEKYFQTIIAYQQAREKSTIHTGFLEYLLKNAKAVQ